MLYLDTAVLLTLFLPEPPISQQVEAWLQRQQDSNAFSEWGLTEAASALGIRVRRGDYTRPQAALVWQAISGFAQQHCHMLPLNSQHLHTAQTWLSHFDLNLRAGDAVHLAIAQAHGATLVTYDRHFLASASALGIATCDPTESASL